MVSLAVSAMELGVLDSFPESLDADKALTLDPGTKASLGQGSPEAEMATSQAVDYSRIFGVHDSLQMVWVLNGDSLITTPFNNEVSPVSLDLMTCTDKEFHHAEKGNPVYLGIKNNHLCLFCEEIQGQPTLQLKEKKIMDVHNEKKGQKPFLFFHNKEGSTSTFQSVCYPDWFIATSKIAGQPLILTKERGKNYITNFYLEPQD